MSEHELREDDALDVSEIDIEADEPADIESAINEALAAVEESARASAAEGAAPVSGTTDQVGPAVARAPSAGEADSGVSHLHEELADLRDRSARTLADFDNYRKRIERERRQERRFIALEILREFLSVIDNLERALAAGGPADDLKTGVELILRQMRDLLRTQGVQRIAAVGEPFDPNVHEAVSRFEDPAIEVPVVSEELQSGYVLHDRLMRPAIVKVAMPSEAETDDDASEEEVPVSQ